MQSTKPHRRNGEAVDGTVGRLVVACGRWIRLPVLLVWVGVLSYNRYHSVTVIPYTVGLVGAAVGLTLVAALLETDSDGSGSRLIPATGQRSTADRLLLVGCLFGLTAGTAGVVSAAGGIPASQPQFADSALLAGALVVGSLFVLVGRWFGPVVAGFAVVGIGVGWLTAPAGLPLIETMVYDSRGIYGSLTQAAASWIAPACLLTGLWRTSGTVDRLRTLVPTIAVDAPSTEWPERLSRGLWQLTPPVGVATLLIAWLAPAVSYLQVVAVAAVPAAVCWLGVIVAGRLAGTPIEFTRGDSVDWRAWSGPLLLAGGPLVVMAALLVVARLPLGTVLLAGNLLAIGLCVLGPLGGFGTGDGASGRLRTGIGTVLDGSAVGLGLFARVAVLLAVVGGITVVIQTALSTWLVSSLLWLSGRTLLAVVVLGGCCVGLGVTLPVVAGYATGAVVVVPLFVTLTTVSELTAHLVVWYAVVGGWLVAPAVDQQLRRLGDQW
ncbi:hypothetical protein halTADL_1830 [Halohasta litchfieldiae]|jgi:hypothetical protein|uniref:Uncharacterized protein n=1 Tax=Halohasta litchfieldiae TaxID=1073996 RepID=A0A1H6R9N2_9EURY|nr:hypothetical protein [Halohasta litchfieldiae]ATW88584.1 hypothetical protein halTADL_1830 [Halohasta litchfieldiae]SEI48325.1 hypothetical protein SAMN05444271_101136 [Halohasta litchfieldiae]